MGKKRLHIIDAIMLIDDWLTCRMCQIYNSETGKPEPEATGILIQLNNLKILVTAGHVVMDKNLNHLLIPNRKSEGFSFLEGIWFPSDRRSNVGKDSDDFAYLVLDHKTAKKLEKEGHEFCNESQLDLHHDPNEDCLYTIMGFRFNKTEIKGNDRFARKELITNRGLPNIYYESEEFSERKILIKNERKLFIVKTRQKGITGNLKGLSGGPIWHTSLSHFYHETNPTVKLVGILNEFSTDKIIGTKIECLVDLMKKRKQIY